jgi:hypothetical protein
MDTQSLPIVPFGRYKGKPVTEFLADTAYVEWCKKQPGMLEKNPIIYNIVVNQQITSSSQNSKTPEHNRLQNLFLNPDNLGKLRKLLFKTYLANFEIKLNNLINDEEFIRLFGKHKKEDLMDFTYPGKVIFEDKYNWDMCYYTSTIPIYFKLDKTEYKEQYDIKKEEYMTKIIEEREERWDRRFITDEEFKKKCEDIYEKRFSDHYEEYSNNCYKGFLRKYFSGYNYGYSSNGMSIDLFSDNLLCCEIKPSLGDDYPEVLRKMKTQQSLSDNDKKWAPSEYICYKKKYLLIIGSFKSKAASREQLIEIFKQSNIIVKFINDIIPSSCIEQLPSNDASMLISSEQQLLKEDKALKDNESHLQQKLSQSEEEIKQLKEQNKKLEEQYKKLEEQYKKLEEELTLLKTPKTTKTITDYFGKKK